MADLALLINEVSVRSAGVRNLLATAHAEHTAAAQGAALLEQVDHVLRALMKSQTDEAFKEVETLLLRALQMVFGDQFTGVTLECSQKRGRLWADVSFQCRGIEGPPLDAFGGGPASVAAFILRFLVVRRLGLAPLLLLDETFSQVSASAVPGLAKFLRLLVDKLGFTILLVTHQPAFLDAATVAYRASHDGEETHFEQVTRA